MKSPSHYLWISIFSIILSCKPSSNNNSDLIYPDSIILNDEKLSAEIDTLDYGLPIFYNMYLSVELSTLFDTLETAFNSELLNFTESLKYYNTSSKKALNLGVYAVDLSYIRVFDQVELTSKYFNAMQRLSEELGIPSEYFTNTTKRLERNINNKDSLIQLANGVYSATDEYLKNNEQYSSSAQIILGGWIEAMYIAVNIAREGGNFEIYDCIAEQTFSLKHLIEMLSEYKNDKMILLYTNEIEQLSTPLSQLRDEIEKKADYLNNKTPEATKSLVALSDELAALIQELRLKIIS